MQKRLIDKLVLECEDEILSAISLNTTDTNSIAGKKVACKNNCLIYIILLTIVFNIPSYYFYQLLLLLYKILVKKRILKKLILKIIYTTVFKI